VIYPRRNQDKEERAKVEQYYLKHPEKERPRELKHKFIPALFYCGWLESKTKKEKKIKKDVESCFPYCCFNHLVGLPTIKYEDENGVVVSESKGVPLHPYEQEILNHYEDNNYYALNKCRGAGASELLTIRWMLYKYCITRIKNRLCMIVGGINEKEAVEYLTRMKELADRIPFMYRVAPKSDTPNVIYLKIGIIRATPANPQAVRSYQNVGDILLEESAFWKLIDDSPILKSAEPHVIKSSAHIGAVSTPNGQSGFFWNKIFNPEVKTKYFKHVLNWRDVVKYEPSVISEVEVEKLRVEDPTTYEQELDNKFLLSENRAFGDFDVADFEPIDFDEEAFE